MGARDHYVPGDWNVACAECGRKRKASEVIKTWKGLYVCREHFEVRHSQDFVRAPKESITPPFVQLQIDIDIPTVCEANLHTAIPGYALPGCAHPDVTDIP